MIVLNHRCQPIVWLQQGISRSPVSVQRKTLPYIFTLPTLRNNSSTNAEAAPSSIDDDVLEGLPKALQRPSKGVSEHQLSLSSLSRYANFAICFFPKRVLPSIFITTLFHTFTLLHNDLLSQDILDDRQIPLLALHDLFQIL